MQDEFIFKVNFSSGFNPFKKIYFLNSTTVISTPKNKNCSDQFHCSVIIKWKIGETHKGKPLKNHPWINKEITTIQKHKKSKNCYKFFLKRFLLVSSMCATLVYRNELWTMDIYIKESQILNDFAVARCHWNQETDGFCDTHYGNYEPKTVIFSFDQ